MIPAQLKSQLQEHTSMGYMFFYTDGNGDPAHHFDFDCDVAYHGLAGYADMILKSLKELDQERFRDFMLEQIEEVDRDEGEDAL